MKDTRRKVLDAAIQGLAQAGLAGAGLNDVVAASGAPRGSLYHHFPHGKLQWVEEALRLYAETFSAGCEVALAKAPSVPQGIVGIFQHAARGMQARQFQGGCPVGAVALDLDAASEPLRAVCLDIMAGWERQLAGHLGALPAARAQALAKLVIACFEGAFMLSRLERSQAPLLLAAEQMGWLIDAQLAAAHALVPFVDRPPP